ncbi:MAG TPA: hypothetical protein VMD92_07185 [Acidobacteriaceae bacterium]|nr:hypothetical protein [Acidobacteriaceae bacterium]
MTRSPLVLLSAVSLCALLVPALPARAQARSLPQLGAPVPGFVTADKHTKECSTGPGHKDPCAEIEIDKIRYTVAWSAQTKAVTWLFTEDHRIVTDTQLAVGNACRLVQDSGTPDATVSYLKWIIDPRWKGPATNFTGNAVWYAAIHKDPLDHTFGDIVGFVQSAYLPLKP